MQTEPDRERRVAGREGHPRAPSRGARTWRRLRRIAGGVGLIARGLADTAHPLLAQIVPIRRCNIDCAYCNEYDKVSPPVPTDVMTRRIDRLAELRTEAVSFTGGEPLLHPSLTGLVAHVRARGMTAALITNGYLLSIARIRELNDAGLQYLQISLDNVNPDDVSKKSLRLLDRKLEWLAGEAVFDVHVNTVVGAGTRRAEDALVIARRARALGLSTSVGIIHDRHGQLKPLSAEERQIYEQVRAVGTHGAWLFKNLYSGLVKFEANLVEGRPNTWRCRAGARYLYVCEDGLVHYCSQQRGTPGIPLDTYTLDDIERAYRTPKGCAPFCTIGCVHRVSIMDFWRDPQTAPNAEREAQRRND
jgi:MoaA/NifB/PqqE/SkfB family radical SAM enzyme